MKSLKNLLLISFIAIFTITGFKIDIKNNVEKKQVKVNQQYKSVVVADALALPLPECGIFYHDDVNLLDQFVPYRITPIFGGYPYYYSDSNLTTFVPDGYYSDPNTAYVIPNGYRLYFHIVDGHIIEHLYIETEIEDPGAPWCP